MVLLAGQSSVGWLVVSHWQHLLLGGAAKVQ